MTRLIDTHVHLTDPKMVEDQADVLVRAREAGVGTMVSIGATVEEAERSIALAHAEPGVFATAGLHPHEARVWSADIEARVRAFAEDPKVVAIGETGLDYHYDFSPRDAQMIAFRAQVALAKECDLPVVIHCREAVDDVLDVLESEGGGNLRGVFHCFSENLDAARRVFELGFFIGLGGVVTFKNSEPLRDVIREVGLDRAVLETDAPHLAPVPRRGKRNEPSFVPHVAASLAGTLQISVEEVAAITTRNARALYRLPG
jgi:TatD DNase family protein